MPQSPEETRGHRIRLPLALTTGAARCYSNTKKKKREMPPNCERKSSKRANACRRRNRNRRLPPPSPPISKLADEHGRRPVRPAPERLGYRQFHPYFYFFPPFSRDPSIFLGLPLFAFATFTSPLPLRSHSPTSTTSKRSVSLCRASFLLLLLLRSYRGASSA